MTTKKQPKAPATPAAGYAGHKAGSRKGLIHQLYDTEGVDVAWTRGRKAGLQESTLRTWFVVFRRAQGKGKDQVKAPPVKKATPKKKSKAPTNKATPAQAKPNGGTAVAAS
jgi:hypothetical protein